MPPRLRFRRDRPLRRQRAPGLVLVAVVAGTAAGACARAGAEAASRPNSVVLLTLDTTRADRIGAYGHDAAHTPTLDELARRGALLERAYAATPVTLPSHATLLSGLYPPSHGVRDNGIHALPAEVVTLPEILGRAGFRTAAFVSAAVLARRYGLAQGFDLYDDELAGGRPREPRMVAERGADRTIDAALRWLDSVGSDEPLFLWVHLFDPHAPYAPPPAWAQRFAADAYDGEIAFVDAEIARLLAHPRLDRGAHAGGLLVMAVADHGESLGEHGEASHGMLPYEATLRVPWIVVGPGVGAGVRVTDPVSHVDLLPTALALLGVDAPQPGVAIEGVSLAPVLRGRSAHDRARGASIAAPARLVYAETLVPYFAYGWAPLRAGIAGPWKLIDAPVPELYDVVSDPAEARNVYDRESTRAAALRRDLAARWGAVDALPREARAPADAAAEATLRSLGYVGGRAAGTARDRPPADPKTMMDVHRGVERGEAHLYARDFAGAIRELRAVLERDPGNLAALEDIALALGELGRFDEAERALRRALDLAPANGGLQLTLAQLNGGRGRWEDALAGAEAALAVAPADTGALALRAEALDRVGRRQEAADAIAAALRLAPGEPLLEVRHAEIVDLPAGRREEAEARLLRATRAEPYLATAWWSLGRVLEAEGRRAEARAAYEGGLRFQPRDATLHAALGLLLADRESASSQEHLEQAVALSPSPPAAVLNALADLAAAAGDDRRATSLRTRVAGTEPVSPQDRHQRAIALRALGRGTEAETAWRELVAVADHGPAWQGLAVAAADRGDWRAAQEAARRAVEIDATLATAWNVLALATEKSADKEGAVVLYRRAVAADPRYWQASFNLGLLLRDLGRAREAADALEAAAGREPGHASTRYELGLLYANALDDAARARLHLEAALRLDPAHARTEEARRSLGRLPSP